MDKEERAAKRQRKDSKPDVKVAYASEKVLEHDTAVAVGINANQLTEEEEGLLPPGTDEQLYTKVRNHILAKWRADVTRWLSEEEAGSRVDPRFRYLVAPAYSFLSAYGYINFGVAPEIKSKQMGVLDNKEAVIIIGAGLAGLAAARQLRAFGHRVLVVEARDRPGGRVYTKRVEAQGQVAAADLGGSIVTGIDGNPLAVLARQLNIPMHDINTSSSGFAIHLDNGTTPDAVLDDEIYQEFNDLLDTCSKHRDDFGELADSISLGTALETLWASQHPNAAARNPRPPPTSSPPPSKPSTIQATTATTTSAPSPSSQPNQTCTLPSSSPPANAPQSSAENPAASNSTMTNADAAALPSQATEPAATSNPTDPIPLPSGPSPSETPAATKSSAPEFPADPAVPSVPAVPKDQTDNSEQLPTSGPEAPLHPPPTANPSVTPSISDADGGDQYRSTTTTTPSDPHHTLEPTPTTSDANTPLQPAPLPAAAAFNGTPHDLDTPTAPSGTHPLSAPNPAVHVENPTTDPMPIDNPESHPTTSKPVEVTDTPSTAPSPAPPLENPASACIPAHHPGDPANDGTPKDTPKSLPSEPMQVDPPTTAQSPTSLPSDAHPPSKPSPSPNDTNNNAPSTTAHTPQDAPSIANPPLDNPDQTADPIPSLPLPTPPPENTTSPKDLQQPVTNGSIPPVESPPAVSNDTLVSGHEPKCPMDETPAAPNTHPAPQAESNGNAVDKLPTENLHDPMSGGTFNDDSPAQAMDLEPQTNSAPLQHPEDAAAKSPTTSGAPEQPPSSPSTPSTQNGNPATLSKPEPDAPAPPTAVAITEPSTDPTPPASTPNPAPASTHHVSPISSKSPDTPLHPGPAPKGTHIPRSSATHRPPSDSKSQSADPVLLRQLFDWHMANVEFANAAKAETLSLKSWDLDDPYEFLGAHVFLPGGNLRLVAALAEGIPVLYKSTVSKVQYSQRGVVVQLADSSVIKADAVLVTIPLGVLKSGSVDFEPPLPGRKLEAIQRLGFGVLNKVVLLFPYVFWDEKLDMFGRVVEDTEHRGDAYLFYSYAHISGGALLAGLMAGKAAVALEEQEPGDAVQRVMSWLRRVYEPQGITVPPPIQAVVTRWGSDPYARGSYSSCRVGSQGGDDYDIMAENVGGRVFFAGEATIKKYPATMHGAFISGMREAANIAAHFRRPKSESGADGVAAGEESGRDLLPPSMDSVNRMKQIVATARALKQVFEEQEADIEFGFISALWGPEGQDSPFGEDALVRVDIGSMRSSSRKNLVVYTTLTRSQVYSLREVKGGDEARLALMTEHYAVKLLGRSSLEPRTLQLFAAIVIARGLQVDLAELGLAGLMEDGVEAGNGVLAGG